MVEYGESREQSGWQGHPLIEQCKGPRDKEQEGVEQSSFIKGITIYLMAELSD